MKKILYLHRRHFYENLVLPALGRVQDDVAVIIKDDIPNNRRAFLSSFKTYLRDDNVLYVFGLDAVEELYIILNFNVVNCRICYVQHGLYSQKEKRKNRVLRVFKHLGFYLFHLSFFFKYFKSCINFTLFRKVSIVFHRSFLFSQRDILYHNLRISTDQFVILDYPYNFISNSTKKLPRNNSILYVHQPFIEHGLSKWTYNAEALFLKELANLCKINGYNIYIKLHPMNRRIDFGDLGMIELDFLSQEDICKFDFIIGYFSLYLKELESINPNILRIKRPDIDYTGDDMFEYPAVHLSDLDFKREILPTLNSFKESIFFNFLNSEYL